MQLSQTGTKIAGRHVLIKDVNKRNPRGGFYKLVLFIDVVVAKCGFREEISEHLLEAECFIVALKGCNCNITMPVNSVGGSMVP